MARHNNFFTPYVIKNMCRIRRLKNRYVGLNSITPLYLACAKQDEEMVRFLLSTNSNVNAKNIDGKTALHVACAKNNLRIVQMLLNKNADVNVCDNVGNTPLHMACINGNEKITSILLDKNANVNVSNNANVFPLHLACYVGNNNLVKLLLEKGARVNCKAKYGITPLHYACLVGKLDIVKSLLNACVNPNIKDESGKFAINIACSNNYPDIVNELIKANSYVPLNIIDWAIHKEEMEILKSLARRRDVAKHLIKKLIVSNKPNLLREIRNARINLNSMDKVDGVSLLQLAVKNNNIAMANILMAYNFGGINDTIEKLNELINDVSANELLKETKNEDRAVIKDMKRERECENILDILYQRKSKKCKKMQNKTLC